MKKTCIKILSVVLCAVIALGAAPLGGLVGLDLPGLFDFKAEAAIYHGTCGDKLTWLLNTSTGVLNIIGTGSMQNYSSESTPWYLYRGYIKTVNIPDGLTAIGNYAFYDCSSLTSVTIPNGVASIGDFAFRYCSKLTSVTIPDSVITIGDDAFYSCYNLTSVTIPDSVITIGDNAFADCYSLKSVTIGNSVTTIGFATFDYCSSLTSITIPRSVTTIGYAAFDDCDSLTDVYYGSTEEDWNKITIGLSNEPLTSATIHFSEPTIASGKCGENVTWTLYERGLLDIIGTGKIDFSYSEEYGLPWFSYRSYIKTVNIGNGVTNIPGESFRMSSNLTRVTIPESVTEMGPGVFLECNSLERIEVDANNNHFSNDEYGVLFNKDKTELIQYPIGNARTSYTIPDNVISICDYAFSYCKNLTNILIPDSVITIGLTAFANCINLASVTVPDSVTTIGDGAFMFCIGLTNVIIGNGVKAIGNQAFAVCYNVTNFEVAPDNNYYSNDSYGALFDKNKTELINYSAANAIKNYSIPDTVTSVRPFAAVGSQNLISVIIPESVTNIGDCAFWYCENLSDVYYMGSESRWKNIFIDSDNDSILNATIHYNHAHALNNIIESVDPTCDKTGYKKGTCVCGCDVTEEIPVKLHSHTAKSDSAQHWEECVCGSKINVQSHSFVGGNVCSCGFKRTVDSTIKIKNNSGSKTINYGETLKLTAAVTDKPANSKIYWYIDGEQKGEGEIFDVKFESGTKIITVKLVDENGVVYQNANDEEISESENATVKAGFFQKLISFFKNLFRMNRTVVQ